jgi:hypothetical protein
MRLRFALGRLAALGLAAGLGTAPLAAQDSTPRHDGMAGHGMAGHGMADSMADHGMAEHGMMQDAMGITSRGTFSGAEGHRAKGSFEITTTSGTTRVALGDDFSVQRGPDVYVVLSPGPKVPKQGALNLGKLARFSGAQSYQIPAGTDLAAYTHVVIWCRKYDVAMGTAPLASGAGMMHK